MWDDFCVANNWCEVKNKWKNSNYYIGYDIRAKNLSWLGFLLLNSITTLIMEFGNSGSLVFWWWCRRNSYSLAMDVLEEESIGGFCCLSATPQKKAIQPFELNYNTKLAAAAAAAAEEEERRQSHKHSRKKHSLPPLLLFTRTTVS